jgi:hypothetical protein
VAILFDSEYIRAWKIFMKADINCKFKITQVDKKSKIMHVLTFTVIAVAEIYVIVLTIWVCRLIERLLERPADPLAMLQHISAYIPQQLRDRIVRYVQQMYMPSTDACMRDHAPTCDPVARPRFTRTIETVTP